MKKLIVLFFELFKISLFVIGGGYAILSVADEVFSKKGWIKEGELFEHLPIFQMIPGLIATHTAVYMGNKMAGKLGAAIGVVAVAIPSIVIFTFVAVGYDFIPVENVYLKGAFCGLRSAVTGIILATTLKNWKKSLPESPAYGMMLAALFAIVYLKINIVYVLLAAIMVGIAREYLPKGKVFNSSILALLVFLKYGLIGFGGGFVLVPVYMADFVGPMAPYLQISTEEFSNLVALTQMTPGPTAVNNATFFGFKLFGVTGAIFASILLLLPGSVLAIMALRSLDKFKTSKIVRGIMAGVKPCSIALMISAIIAFIPMSNFLITALVVAALLSKKVGVMTAIYLSAIIGVILK